MEVLIMITKECKNVLYELKLLTSNTESEISFIADTTYLCLSDDERKLYNYQKYKNEIYGILDQLEADGYVSFTFNEYHFRLTQKAIHKNQFALSDISNYLRDKMIDILALVISVIALLKSYGYDVVTPFVTSCKQLLEQLLR